MSVRIYICIYSRIYIYLQKQSQYHHTFLRHVPIYNEDRKNIHHYHYMNKNVMQIDFASQFPLVSFLQYFLGHIFFSKIFPHQNVSLPETSVDFFPAVILNLDSFLLRYFFGVFTR